MLGRRARHPLSILLVEDEHDLRNALAELLMLHGHTVVTACDGREAMEVLTTNPVQVIISDIHMPNVSGTQLHERVRSDPRFHLLPFIFITGYTILRVATPLQSPGLDFMVNKVPFRELMDLVNDFAVGDDVSLQEA